ncbi:DNA-binding transcriptional regulator [Thalassobaculum sp.]|uniref:helix-turn-helix domain-containing protein n=1 Tax=Thalassobaculum sp. TaxID=2022740 RepID=UPI0032EC48E9
MANRIYRNDLSAAVHEMAEGLHEVAAIDKRTMREFDEACLAPVPEYTGQQIREIRERERASQAVFARYLGASVSQVVGWKQGIKKPSGPARRLLSIVERQGPIVLGF